MDYNRMAARVLKQLTKYGQSAILRPMSLSIYDPNSGIASQDGTTGVYDQVRQVLPTDQPGKRIAAQFGQTLQNGTLMQRSDKWVYMDANGIKPALQDIVILMGVSYNVVDVQETNPGGIPLLYLIVLRT